MKRTMRRLLPVALALTALGGAVASPTAAATTPPDGHQPSNPLSWVETVNMGPAAGDVVFTPNPCGAPSPTCDPRGVGSSFTSRGPLTRADGTRPGTVTVSCPTVDAKLNPAFPPVQVAPGIWVPATDYYGNCTVEMVFSNGSITARGVINETALERYEAQVVQVVAGSGAYAYLAAARSLVTIDQLQYPNIFSLTVTDGAFNPVAPRHYV